MITGTGRDGTVTAMVIKRLLRTVVHTSPATSDTERPVQRWLLRLAYAMPLLLLPSCLWRLPFAVHVEMGQTHEESLPSYWVSVPYVLTLSVLSELIAVLCIGLVRRWGEVAPVRIPVIGGKRVPPLAAVVPAIIGGLILTALFTSIPLGADRELSFFGVGEHQAYDNGWWKALALICTGPLRVWGPAVIVLAIAYYLRRRPGADARLRPPAERVPADV
ncbi:hypothetical protein GCM10010182_57460 [Actinomadura cremea]|nr:hypothetical protein GCM10010182_57460 [Actinomadura cremea]